MDNYLVSYEYKVKNGSLVTTKTATKVFTLQELKDFTQKNDLYDNYVKVIFCAKL